MSVSHPQLLSALNSNGSLKQFSNPFPNRRSQQVATLLAALTVMSGCSSEPQRVPVFPVTGKVTFKGKPADGAQVVLFPVNTENAAELAPSGKVGKDGTFSLTAYEPGDGAPEGDYVATISWRKLVGGGEGGAVAGPNVIPKQYGSAATSPVKISVKGGPTQVPPIAIK
jgi:hypothetical protein